MKKLFARIRGSPFMLFFCLCFIAIVIAIMGLNTVTIAATSFLGGGDRIMALTNTGSGIKTLGQEEEPGAKIMSLTDINGAVKMTASPTFACMTKAQDKKNYIIAFTLKRQNESAIVESSAVNRGYCRTGGDNRFLQIVKILVYHPSAAEKEQKYIC